MTRMSASFPTLLTTLQQGAQHVLSTAAEVDAVVLSAGQLVAHHHRRLASPWSVPRLLSGVLRTQLNARIAHTSHTPATALPPLSCLVLLLVEAWRLCPLSTLPPHPSPAGPQAYSLVSAFTVLRISRNDMDRVAEELKGLQSRMDAGDDVYRTALSLLLAFVTYWHIIAAEETETDSDDEHAFCTVSATVWHCILRWTTCAASDGARCAALTTWLSILLRRALRTGSVASLLWVVQWLETFLSAESDTACTTASASASSPISTPPNAGLELCWAQLHLRLLQHVSTSLHASQTLLKVRWAVGVAPVLTRALASEPPLLSGAALRAFDFGASLEDSLGLLVQEAQCATHGCSVSESGSDGYPAVIAQLLASLLQLAALQRRVDAARLRVTPFITAQTYRMHVRPIVAVCLRQGMEDVAVALLEWSHEGLDAHGREWLRRLRRETTNTDAGFVSQLATALHGGEGSERREGNVSGGCGYSQWLRQQEQEAPERWWTVSEALDVLVDCSDMHPLRLVGDAALRFASPRYIPMLRDPFATHFLLRALTTLAMHFLDVGDAPLARYYIALHGQLLHRYLCPPALLDFLRLLRRCAHVLSCRRLSPPLSAAMSTTTTAYDEALVRWQSVRRYLDGAETCDGGGCTVPPSHKSAAGTAWKARHAFHAFCTANPSRAPDPANDGGSNCRCGNVHGTVVEVHYDAEEGGTLCLQCGDFNNSAASPNGGGFALRYAVRCGSVGTPMRGCVAEMSSVVRCNRRQLLHGSGGAAGAERAPCAESHGGPQCGASSLDAAAEDVHAHPHHHRRRQKEEWWRLRYALDARVGGVVSTLQKLLGVRRALLAGRPSADLSAALHTIAASFTTSCAALRVGQPCPPPHALHEAVMCVLLAGPFLWATSRGAKDVQPTCLYDPTAGGDAACAACVVTRRTAQTTLLTAIVDLGQSTCSPSPLQSKSLTEDVDEDEAWLSLLLDSAVTSATKVMATAALDAYHRECAAVCPPSSTSFASHAHLDLLLHPREHVYLVLGSELHGLPWEGLDVCTGRSVSRVPSLDYLQRASAAFSCDTCAVSLRRTLVYRDSDAQGSDPALLTVLEAHPDWAVVYGDTLRGATAALEDGRQTPTAPQPLLRRVVGPVGDTDHIDAYVYSGHKGGEHLLSRAGLYEWLPPGQHTLPSLILLMGCSSARLQDSALCEGFGLPFAYLSAGVSCMVGCLWDVTDGDVDRLTCRLLKTAAASGATTTAALTVGEALAVSRRACKLRCLTGLATIFYGLNLPIDGSTSDVRKDSLPL